MLWGEFKYITEIKFNFMIKKYILRILKFKFKKKGIT